MRARTIFLSDVLSAVMGETKVGGHKRVKLESEPALRAVS